MILDFKSKREFEKYYTAILFAVSSWIFLLSSVYARNGNTYLGINFLQIIVYFILGAMNAAVDMLYYSKPLLFYKWERIELKVQLFIRWLVMAFAYTGIYQCVLLPFSGLGLVEWIFVAIMLGLMLENYLHPSKNMMLNSPSTPLLLFQVVLFFIKLIAWFAPENLYRALITGNDTARWIIAVLFSFFLISGILSLRRKVLPVSDEQTSKIKDSGKKIVYLLKKIVSYIKGFILSLVNGPVIILVVLAVCVLLVCFGSAAFIVKIKSDILKFLESFLPSLLSTGKYQVQQTPIYIFSQLGAIILYALYQFMVIPIEIQDDDIFDYIEDNVEENAEHLSQEEKNHLMEKFKDLYRNNKKLLIYNIDAYKKLCFKELNESKEIKKDE